MIRSALVSALAALAGCGACPTPEPVPAPAVVAIAPAPRMVECQAFLPGVGEAPEDVVDAWFFAWVAQFDTVEYLGSASGWWTDGSGHLIGWSAEEDATICVVDWPGYPTGAPSYPSTVEGVTTP